MAEKSIIIIGAGIAGLAAGCYGQMNGYDTQIFELHDRPGGLCTAWERKGYTFDGCIHYLFGSGRGQPYNQVWQELGAVQGRPMIDHEKFMEIVDPAGQRLIVYSDPERLAAHMKALSPEDAELIDALAGGIRQFTRFDMSVLQQKPRALMGVEDWREFGAQMMPYLGALMKWGRMSAQEFADRCHSPFLRRAIPQMFAWPDIPMMAGLSLLAYMHTGNAGFPAGGSLAFAQAIEQRYLALGGQIHYKAHVEKILVVDDRAVGVRLYTDEERRADYVISAADGRNTVFEMLDGQYADRRIRQQYDGRLPIHSQIQVSLGVNADLSAAPHWATYLLDEPLVLAGEPYAQLSVKHYGFDASLAPAGKSAVVVMFKADYAYWQRIYGRRLYDTEQLQVAGTVIDFLERLYPGIQGQIEVKDVATPLSYERFTGNWQGSSCGWLLTKETMGLMIQGLDKSLPGLANFYMAGQWVEPGGSVPVAAMSGRNAIQLVCANDERPFVTSLPEDGPAPAG